MQQVDNVMQLQQAHLLSTCLIRKYEFSVGFQVNYDQFEIQQCVGKRALSNRTRMIGVECKYMAS